MTLMQEENAVGLVETYSGKRKTLSLKPNQNPNCSLNTNLMLTQWFPNFFVHRTLQGYLKWTKNPCLNF